MVSKNRGRTGIKNSSGKQKIRPAPKLKVPSDAVGALLTISSAPQVQTRVPVVDMESPGEASGQILTPRASNLPSNATPTHLPSPVTDNDTDQDIEMTQPTVDATPADENTASVWVDSVEEGVKQLKMLYSMTRTDKTRPFKPSEKEVKRYTKSMRAFLLFLKHDVEPKPDFKDKYSLDTALGFYLGPGMESLKKAAPDLLLLAREVLEQYNAEEWGKGFTDDGEEEEIEADDLGPAIATSSKKGKQSHDTSSSDHTEVVKLPPVSHPIWGLEGIMHGLARKTTKKGRAVLFLDPRYHNKKRNAKVFGHNDHTPGAWWPYQKAALFHGAHGAPQAGITGNPNLGTYSIVVSATSVYRDLNEDKGTELWYSADKSAENADPLKPKISNATRSLEKALETHKPVRVLRHAGTTCDPRRSPIYPTVGIRYDGLYEVVNHKFGTNKNNGVFKRFKLVRLPDSMNAGVSWAEVQRYPTREQRRQFDQTKDGY
ncbi:PUA-like domain-containing protein [Neurospora hispaniola]|uniref:PUA-like domain-containing protein n=1 Tax=Neurospora hispaniola TaxID=588809 RepID=A0AAJ0I0Q3_9PEZI|nr:PUA-like domain-containing protein [Neurospora hispaniola]